LVLCALYFDVKLNLECLNKVPGSKFKAPKSPSYTGYSAGVSLVNDRLNELGFEATDLLLDK
jgi:hypothetical protein